MTGLVHLGIDVGGTASRWVACDPDGEIVDRGSAAGATGHVFNPVELERLRGAMTAIAQALADRDLSAASVTAGLTGYGAVAAEQARTLLADCLGTPGGNIIIVDDMTLAYAANFKPGEGHLVSAGTGSIGLHIDQDSYVRVGGRGILIDDGGSGSWIALRALDQIYRCLDRTGDFSAVDGLAQQLFAIIGSAEWHAVRQFVYGGDRGRIGTLAVAVGAAARDGDAVALQILRDAAAELAALAKALGARAGSRPIGFIGGVLNLHPVIGEEIARLLHPEEVRFVQSDPALAAARLNTMEHGAWKPLLQKTSTLG
tara:strand:- start:385 stop:1326 length:942 start_codon:yes stop_codon:yes gene_type:complete